ncbi:sulfatase [uncultured Cyclobacterium sp.]|uniref:sulfatase family protein n=1 Tax=uncultured Cyclobacterium sp. TaxID=453820 RepID=UPI0030ED8E64|tara:strand:+ start:13204 stop:14640 length:1437 start_codon:yes stop_codon:yes gene_type:complete
MNYSKIPILLLLPFLLRPFGVWAQDSSPNFVFIITDDISAEDLSIYGNQSIDTPNLERLAMMGLVFDNAYLTTSSCSPSRISMITGRYPHNTGAPEIHVELPPSQNTFVKELKKNGYHTVLSGKNHMAPPAQLGFMEHSDSKPAGSENWLTHLKNRPKDQPFFFWLASHDAHRDWQINGKARIYLPNQVEVQPYLYDGPLTRKDLTGYYHEISRLDHYVGLVLDELETQGIIDNTYIIFLTDNGRPFPRSKTYLYKNGIQTPLLIAGPQVKQGRTNALVSAIDVSATILELAGLSVPETIQGISFSEVFQNHGAVVREVAFAERNWHRYSMHERMVRMGEWIYIRNNWPNKRNLSGESDPSAFPAAKELWSKLEEGQLTPAQSLITLLPQPAEELYHIKKDPHNLNNVVYAPENRELLNQMRILLISWTNQTGDNIPDDPTPHKATLEGRLLEWERREMPGDATNASQINQSGPIRIK